jgi:hypothetical protein
MKKSLQIQIILSVAVLIVLNINANFTDVNQVFFSATHEVVFWTSHGAVDNLGL